MNVDLRFPLGLLFIVFGGLLTLVGLCTDRASYERSLFINVNLWRGVGDASLRWANVLGRLEKSSS